MNLIFRLIYVIVHAFFRPKLDFLDESVVCFRVLPNDLDVNFHMTNSRYLSIMDLGRIDHLIRTGVTRHFFRNKWRPVLGAIHVRYRRALGLFQKYELHSKIKAIDEKWVYFEQRLICNGDLVSYALAKGAFVGHDGTIPMKTVMKELGTGKVKLPIVKSIQDWIEMEKSINNDTSVRIHKKKHKK